MVVPELENGFQRIPKRSLKIKKSKLFKLFIDTI